MGLSKSASAQRKAEELIRCGRDPIYFITEYCKIENNGLKNFELWPFQEDAIQDYLKHDRNIILKSRQIGMSTVTAAYATWLFLFYPHSNILVIATKLSTAKIFIRKVKTILKYLPEWMRISQITKETQQELENDQGSILKAAPTGDDVGRGESLSLLIVDEAAFIKDFEKIWIGLQPTLSTSKGRVIILSCVTKDTWVFTDGGPKQVGEFVVDGPRGGYEIPEYKVFGKKKLRAGCLFHNNGKVKTRKLTTKFASIEGSENHKLWSCKNGRYGWRRLDQLSKGDWVSIEYGMNAWGDNDDTSDFRPSTSNKIKSPFSPKKIDEDLAYFLGLFLAEGSSYLVNGKSGLVGGNITITCGDGISESLEALGLPVNTHDNLHYTISSKNLIEFIEYLGFDLSLKAPEKEIPRRLMGMSRRNVVAMLRGIFDGDGFSRKDRGQVGIGLSSKKMIDQIRVLLLNLGILTEYKEYVTRPTDKVLVESVQHRLSCCSSQSEAFYDLVGFGLNRKQDNKVVLEGQDLKRASSKDVIPYGISILKQIREESDISTYQAKKMGIPTGYFAPKYKSEHCSRQNALKMIDGCKDLLTSETLSVLEGIVGRKSRWVQIKDVEEGLEETFDFSLPSNEADQWDHSVVYNGILGHQTPNGVGNMYHKLYERSAKAWEGKVPGEKGCNNFNGIELPWTVVPGRDQKWYEDQCKDLTPEGIAQELECSFVGSGANVIHQQYLDALRKGVKRPDFREGWDKSLWIWKKPKSGHNYIIGADVSRGDSKDYSTFVVIDVQEGELVAEYKGKSPPDRLAEMLDEVGRKYNEALVAVEKNSYGYATLMKLRDFRYPNIYYPNNKQTFVTDYVFDGDISKAGFDTNGKTKPAIIAKLEEVIRNQQIIFPSDRLVSELQTFIWHQNGKAGAMKSYNDDIIMATAIAVWLFDASEYSKETMEANQIMFESMGAKTTQIQDIQSTSPTGARDDFSVWAPVAGSGATQTPMNRRGGVQQKLSKGWEWLLK